VLSFTSRLFNRRGKSPRYPLDRRLVGPQSQSGRRGEVKIPTPPRFELRPLGRPARSQSLYRLSYHGSYLSLYQKYFMWFHSCPIRWQIFFKRNTAGSLSPRTRRSQAGNGHSLYIWTTATKIMNSQPLARLNSLALHGSKNSFPYKAVCILFWECRPDSSTAGLNSEPESYEHCVTHIIARQRLRTNIPEITVSTIQ
jgi:hypothetical protein